MIAVPEESSSIIRTIGIDPGTTKLGLSVMEINVDTLLIEKTFAFTLRGDKLANNTLFDEFYGNRYSRISGMMAEILGIMNYQQPFAISSEAPFFNPRMPGAFEPLVEVVSALRETVYKYDPHIPLNMVDPSSVKNAVGAHGGANKTPVKDAVLKLTQINYQSSVPLEDLDDHSIDSIAVNYWYYLRKIRKVEK